MKLYGTENNALVLAELGNRIKEMRILSNLTQNDLAVMAGISLSTVVRLEKGLSVRTDFFLNVLRALDCMSNIQMLVPEQEMRPSEIFENKKRRSRARRAEKPARAWKWGDEK